MCFYLLYYENNNKTVVFTVVMGKKRFLFLHSTDAQEKIPHSAGPASKLLMSKTKDQTNTRRA